MRSSSRHQTWVIASAAVAIGALVSALARPLDVLLYNHSPSIPTGFYLRQSAPIGLGAVVTVRALDVAPAEARARRFTGEGDRFIKRIAAVAGDEVCAKGESLRINNSPALRRKSHDAAGRVLKAWTGCRVLAAHEVLLLGDTEDSFDGRYWGPTERHNIEGTWVPLSF